MGMVLSSYLFDSLLFVPWRPTLMRVSCRVDMIHYCDVVSSWGLLRPSCAVEFCWILRSDCRDIHCVYIRGRTSQIYRSATTLQCRSSKSLGRGNPHVPYFHVKTSSPAAPSDGRLSSPPPTPPAPSFGLFLPFPDNGRLTTRRFLPNAIRRCTVKEETPSG